MTLSDPQCSMHGLVEPLCNGISRSLENVREQVQLAYSCHAMTYLSRSELQGRWRSETNLAAGRAHLANISMNGLHLPAFRQSSYSSTRLAGVCERLPNGHITQGFPVFLCLGIGVEGLSTRSL